MRRLPTLPSWLYVIWAALAFWVAPTAPLQAQSIFTLRNQKLGGPTLRAIANSPTTIVTVGDGGTVLVSSDGSNWNSVNAGVSEALRGILYTGRQFVVVGDNGRILISNDGTTWTASSTGIPVQLNAICYANSMYVAVGEGGTILISSDAQTWTPAASGVTASLRGISSITGDFTFFVGGANGTILTSPNGTTWTLRNAGTTADLEAVLVDLFVGVNSTAVFYGADESIAGTTWVATNTAGGATGNWQGVTISNDGLRFVVGDAGQTAGGGGEFRNFPSGTTEDLKAVTYAQNLFVAVGADETILQEATGSYIGEVNNLSTRAQVSPAAPLTGGFVISGTGTKGLLIRASGPALATFGITSPLASPVLTVYDSMGKVIAQNTGWSNGPNAAQIQPLETSVGAYLFQAGSADCALALNLAPGSYTAMVTGRSSGISLLELYDTDVRPIIPTARLVNLSSLCYVGTGQAAPVTGIIVPTGVQVLIRAVGPTLAQFSVPNPLAHPRIDLMRPAYTSGPIDDQTIYPPQPVANNEGWNTTMPLTATGSSTGLMTFGDADQIRTAALQCGAFALPEGSADAAMLVTLSAEMTLQVTSVDGQTGNVLIEAYDTAP